MKEISRYELYCRIRRIISEGNRGNASEFIQKNLKDTCKEKLNKILEINIIMLKNIEERFLITSYPLSKNIELTSLFFENIQALKQSKFFELKNKTIEKFESLLKPNIDEFYFFNDLIKLLNDISNNDVKIALNHLKTLYDLDPLSLLEPIIDISKLNQVFLSHAFDDKLYTFCLFLFMLDKGIFLYVDWMWSKEFSDGRDIKLNLIKEIKKSDQFLFLRTINSEFVIRGSGNIRGWCSWELGSFYSLGGKNPNEKFFIELYRSKKVHKKNKQLDGISPLKDVISGRLV